MRRIFCTILSLALMAALSSAQDLSKKVTFQCPAETADQVLAQLAKATGVNLTYEASMASEVLLISVKDLSVAKVLQEVATATSGQWMKVADEYRLVPDPEIRQREQSDWLARRTESVAKIMSKEPPGSSLFTILGAMDPATVAQIESGQRVVFSNQPSSAQVATSLLTPENLAAVLNGRIAPDYQNSAPPKAIFAISNSQDVYRVRLYVYDSKGRVIASQAGAMAPMATLVGHPTYTLPDTLASADSAAIDLPDSTKELIKNGLLVAPVNPEKLSKDGQDVLGHPYSHDPLSLYAGPAVAQRATECALPIVADLPDSVAYAQSDSALNFLKDATQKGLLQTKVDKGCLVITPGDPAASRRHRANRKALEVLMQAGLSKKGATLPDMAAFAVAEARPPESATGNDASLPYLKAILPDVQSFSEQNGSFATLRVFGQLTPDQQQAALKNQELPLGDLSANAITALNELVFGADAVVETKATEGPPNPRYGYRRVNSPRSMGFTQGTTYLTEPTDSMTTGYGPRANFCVLASQGRMGSAQPELIFTFTFQLLPDVMVVSTLNASLPKP